MTDDLISRAAAVEVARRHRSKIEVNEPLWHEGQDWASDRIAEALAALPAAQVQAEPVAITGKHFRKKPVVIEAVQWVGSNLDEVMAFCAGNATYELMARGNSELIISTLEDGEGTAQHVASRGDWIIRGVQGEYYPCKPDIFTATYENAYPTPPAPDDMDALVKRLRAPAYWMSGSGEGHEGENNAPREAADAITALRARPATVQVKPLVDMANALLKAARELAQFASYAEIVGGVNVNRPQIREWSDKVFAAIKAVPENNEFERDFAALVASEPAPASHQPPLPSEDAREDSVGRATANRLEVIDTNWRARALYERALRAALDAANTDAERLAEALIWASGSPDFNDGGQAEKGWRKVARPALAAHEARKGGA